MSTEITATYRSFGRPAIEKTFLRKNQAILVFDLYYYADHTKMDSVKEDRYYDRWKKLKETDKNKTLVTAQDGFLLDTLPKNLTADKLGITYEATSQTGWYNIPKVVTPPITVSGKLYAGAPLALYLSQFERSDTDQDFVTPRRIDARLQILPDEASHTLVDVYNFTQLSGNTMMPGNLVSYPVIAAENAASLSKSSIMSPVDLIMDAFVWGNKKHEGDIKTIAEFKDISLSRPRIPTFGCSNNKLLDVTLTFVYKGLKLYSFD